MVIVDHNSANENGASASQVPSVSSPGSAGFSRHPYKINFGLKFVAFVAAVISLSWFFEGWRQVSQAPSIAHVAVLFLGTTGTLLILGVMGYWTYFEEKSKGTLTKKIALYERIHLRLEERSLARKQGEHEHHV